ncbi:hypothetical protein SPHINGO8BC_50761 [Sphingobacterium multivorum]|uniref:Uncharacterized protein n=1 Tax=Sphingobacterium multivorum TaxID=28454 RepID=A0A654CAE4_SPHMU|nr:hypothetical protein SPHINGO8BC_50761 [Sphingobacterium multivorum]
MVKMQLSVITNCYDSFVIVSFKIIESYSILCQIKASLSWTKK